MSKESKSLEEQLGDDDWAIIIGKDGSLKGMFIPEGSDEDDVPLSIVHIMEKYFGIDFGDDEQDNDEDDDNMTRTLH